MLGRKQHLYQQWVWASSSWTERQEMESCLSFLQTAVEIEAFQRIPWKVWLHVVVVWLTDFQNGVKNLLSTAKALQKYRYPPLLTRGAEGFLNTSLPHGERKTKLHSHVWAEHVVSLQRTIIFLFSSGGGASSCCSRLSHLCRSPCSTTLRIGPGHGERLAQRQETDPGQK